MSMQGAVSAEPNRLACFVDHAAVSKPEPPEVSFKIVVLKLHLFVFALAPVLSAKATLKGTAKHI